MTARHPCLHLTLALLPLTAAAGQGMVPPAPDEVWPQWHARIAIQAAQVWPLTLTRLLESGAPPRRLQGASVLGDYTVARASFGSFRASGGLLIGTQGGAPLLAAAGTHLDLALQTAPAGPQPGADSALPYLGFGFSGAALRNALSVTADLGFVAEHAGAAGGLGRALFGNQGLESTLREMRLSPVFQLGLRYTF